MRYQSVAIATSTLLGLAVAAPSVKREVPQEHSHEVFLTITREFLAKENPKNIGDPVFGLLGDAAAQKGAGQVTNLACLQQETADQAFTNAKATKDIRGMSAALVYQAIERNTAGVGKTSAACTDKAVNPEIAALSKKHQDPASPGAAANNKAVTLALAKQLASIGGDPMLALESGTFSPGSTSDNTGKGNSCDNQDDTTGCIFTQKKLVLDATPDEITAAVKGITPTITGGTGELKATHIDFAGLAVAGQSGANTGSNNAGNANNNNNSNNNQNNQNTGNANTGNANTGSNQNGASCPANNNSNNNNNNNTNNSGAETQASNGTADANTGSGNNIQTFTGDLGGLPPPVIQSSGNRPFSVNGNTFVGKGAALGRSCDIQHNACANAANSGQVAGGVSVCDEQNAKCRSQASLRKRFYKRQATDFGSCSDPSVVFKSGLADRKEAAFIANNQKDFNHGSAQKIGIIASFICQRLEQSCKAPKATVDTCNKAATAATAAKQDETAANTFNSILIGGASGASAGANAGASANAGANAGANAPADAAVDC